MNRVGGLLLFGTVIVALFRLDRESDSRVTAAIWIPFTWFFIAASRNVSAWLRLGPGEAGDPYLEGSPFDRTILTVILAGGVIVLLTRIPRVTALLRSNLPILFYFAFCGLSCVWSDFPDVSFKRWFRAMGDVVMVMVVLSDPDWTASFRRMMARIGFLLLPISVLFIRYFPEWGRSYSKGGAPSWVGVATEKNALGMLCLLVGLASLYRFLQLYRSEKSKSRSRSMKAHGALLVMMLYLLIEANSATAVSCFALSGGVMFLTWWSPRARRAPLVHALTFAAVVVPMSALFLGLGSNMVEGLGRDTTFTGRTNIWSHVLNMVPNPLLGAGYESFWLGPRLKQMTIALNQFINQAHNGYIEVYLNLGWVGLILLAGLIITGYRRIIPAVRWQTQAGSLRLAYFISALVYNFSEGGFKMMHPVWIVFLLSIAVVPKAPAEESTDTKAASRRASARWHARPNPSPDAGEGNLEPVKTLKASQVSPQQALPVCHVRPNPAGALPSGLTMALDSTP